MVKRGAAANGELVHGREEIEFLKGNVDLASVVRESGVELERVGEQFMGRCPFHDDATASLSVKDQLWNCFGCEAGGDVISFLQLREGLTFPQAVERLHGRPAARPAPKLHARRPRETGHDDEGNRAEVLSRVVGVYSQRLPESKAAREYLNRRGLASSELWQAFRIGFCYGSLPDVLPHDGPLRGTLSRIGILQSNGREHFRGCVVVPLEHPDQGIVGLYGRRITDDGALAKHLYLPGRQRGVLNWQALKLSSRVVIAESVFDALSLWTAGCRHVTCLYGVRGLPQDLEALLGSFAVRETVFCLDADAPGREATQRLSARLRARGVRSFHAALPEGKDPNEVLVEHGPSVLHERVEQARSLDGDGDAADTSPQASTVHSTADGFELVFSDLTYRVAPLQPSGGKQVVRLAVTRGDRTFYDKVELYSHRSRASFGRQLAERFSLLKEEAEHHLVLMLNEAERWLKARPADAQGEEGVLVTRKAPEMTEAEKEEALTFLRRSDLAHVILSDMEALGYVGEERGKLLAYLIGVSRKLPRPMAGIILSQSGAGKSTLAELVEMLTPPEEMENFSRLTAQALGYVPRDFLKRKLVILEERKGGEAADYSIRVLQSKQKLTQLTVEKDPQTGKMRTRQYEVEGPIAYLETTTDPNLNHENATRCFELTLDESEEQTQRIQRRQRMTRSLDGVREQQRLEDIRQRHHNAQRLLEPLRVIIPYWEHLSFPSRWLRTRRDNERFLCLIEAAAFLHQHQRARGADGDLAYIEATLEDYELAYDLAHEVLGITLHELTREAQDLSVVIRELVCDESDGRDLCSVPFTRRDLRARTGWPDRRLRDALQELVEMEYIAAHGSQGKTYQYRLLHLPSEELPTLGELTTPEALAQLLKHGAAMQR
jgi:DNA primase catalytic core